MTKTEPNLAELQAVGLDAAALRRLADAMDSDADKARRAYEAEQDRISNHPAIPQEDYSGQFDANRIENAAPIVIACMHEILELSRGRNDAAVCRAMGTISRIIHGGRGVPTLLGLLHELDGRKYPLSVAPGPQKGVRVEGFDEAGRRTVQKEFLAPNRPGGPVAPVADVFQKLVKKHLGKRG